MTEHAKTKKFPALTISLRLGPLDKYEIINEIKGALTSLEIFG